MRPGVTIALTAVDRRRLGAIVGNRNVPQKHAWRAEIVLLTADGLGTVEIMRRTGKSKTCVWRWQERFAEEGCEGLLRDKTRPPRIPRLGAEVAERVVALTPPRLLDPRGQPTFGLQFYAVNKAGDFGAASLFPATYAAHDGRDAAVRDAAFLYQRTS